MPRPPLAWGSRSLEAQGSAWVEVRNPPTRFFADRHARADIERERERSTHIHMYIDIHIVNIYVYNCLYATPSPFKTPRGHGALRPNLRTVPSLRIANSLDRAGQNAQAARGYRLTNTPLFQQKSPDSHHSASQPVGARQ